jgi:hypothetical protein
MLIEIIQIATCYVALLLVAALIVGAMLRCEYGAAAMVLTVLAIAPTALCYAGLVRWALLSLVGIPGGLGLGAWYFHRSGCTHRDSCFFSFHWLPRRSRR